MENKYVVFKINNVEFALDIQQVVEIVKPSQISKVPNVPDYIEGIINLRGKVYGVVNLRKRLKFPDKPVDANSNIIMIKVNTLIVGLIVDFVSEILSVDENKIDTTQEAISKTKLNFVKGVIKKGGRKTVAILDVDRLID